MAVFAHRNCVIWPVVLACEKGNWAVKSKLTVSKLTGLKEIIEAWGNFTHKVQQKHQGCVKKPHILMLDKSDGRRTVLL